MAPRKIEFTGHSGAPLAARLDLPPAPPRAWALFAHCFSCSSDISAARHITGRLAALGFGVLRFDFTGLGHSGGEFGVEGFSGDVGDLHAAARFMAEQDMAPALMVGHSLGGAATLAAAVDVPSVRAVAVVGAPASAEHVLSRLGEGVETAETRGTAEVCIAGQSFRVTRRFVEDMRAARVSDAAARLRKALLILHAPRDMEVGIDSAATLFSAARHPKSFVSLDDADHLLTRPQDAAYAAEVIAAWSARYVPPPSEEETASPRAARSVEADPAGFRQQIHVGPHGLAADEPVAQGGTDTAPSPYGLMSSALAACTSMTLRLYARRKEIPLAHVVVEVSHSRVHARDCAACDSEDDAQIDRFERVIRLEGELSPETRARLLEIADRCPVHRTLQGEVEILTREA